jgi:hypothetical protein
MGTEMISIRGSASGRLFLLVAHCVVNHLLNLLAVRRKRPFPDREEEVHGLFHATFFNQVRPVVLGFCQERMVLRGCKLEGRAREAWNVSAGVRARGSEGPEPIALLAASAVITAEAVLG